MKNSLAFFCTVVCSLTFAGVSTAAEAWHPAKAPIMTRWAKDVSPTTPLPEYPRPQMVRHDWMNLNGQWDYSITDNKASTPKSYQGKILVPFCVESALSGVMKSFKPDNLLWYHRTFDVPASFAGKRVLLHFGAVDWQATVFVNGKEVIMHRGGYDGFSIDITNALKPKGPQELVVKVFDPTEGGYPRGKQSLHPSGCFYTPCSGIWQTVWLEPVPTASIAKLHVTPDIDAGVAKLTVNGRSADVKENAKLTVEAIAMDGRRVVARAAGKLNESLTLSIRQPKLWSPDSPFLYDLKVTLLEAGKPIDAVDSYFGMRKFSLGKDAKGATRLMLNNEVVFQTGPLDQGFWPDGIYTAPTDAALKFDIEITKQFGFNVTRKHVKVEPERWYYWCDKLGLPVWQDMPAGDNKTAENKAQFEVELRRMLEERGNHPSIIMWVVFNESWGQFDTERLVKLVKKLDPSRLADNASGWTDKKVGDVIDMHRYPQPGAPKTEPARAAVLGEFGGLGVILPEHSWMKKSWGYKVVSPTQLTRDYAKLLAKAYELRDSDALCAAIYTQITDVEGESNGLLTYDREVVKPAIDIVAMANRGIPTIAPVATVVPTSQEQPAVWTYTFDRPRDNWFKPGYDTYGWKTGEAGFGTKGTTGAVVRTTWKTPDIWLRRDFTLDSTIFHSPQLLMHHDEDAEVFINGVSAAKVHGFVTEYDTLAISPEARAALKQGVNVLAVHCHNKEGGQNIDVGIIDELPMTATTTAGSQPSAAPSHKKCCIRSLLQRVFHRGRIIRGCR